MNYLLHLAIMIGVYLPLAYSLNLLLGFGGLISLSHAAFFGIGAYSYTLLVTRTALPMGLALCFAILITSIMALLIGTISLRFRSDLFVFVTLGFQMIVFVILYNWIDLTNGPYGIAEIPRPDIAGIVVDTPFKYLILAGVMNAAVMLALFPLYKSPFGFTLKIIRDNEIAAESLGIQPNRYFLQAFVISAAVATIPGAFYAAYVTYIDPTSFTVQESILQMAVLLLGGAGNRLGPFLGTVILLLLPEGLRFVGLPDSVAHNIREIIYGLMLIMLMHIRPQGLAGEFKVT